MEESRISRRKGLAILGAAAGSALLGTSLAGVANAAPSVRQTAREAQPNTGYSVDIFNDSELHDFQAIIYQEDPSLDKDVARLAWMTKPCHPHTHLGFGWDVNYNFVWSQVGSLKPGTHFSAGETINADPLDQNCVTLYYDGGYYFSETSHVEGAQLIIQEDKSVPKPEAPGSGSVGIGMAGFGTFVVPTGSGQVIAFTPKPQYWIAFGKFTDSDVMEITQLTARAQLQFEGHTKAEAVYNGTDWTITYG